MAPVDYNLLKPLRALLEERSVTRAAARLHVSQPVMSHHLSRLRDHYDDVLLVRRGNQHTLTPLAERLLDALPQVLAETEQIFRLQAGFDPVTSTRTFVIAGVDYAVARIASALSAAAMRAAPNVRFEFPPVDARLVNGFPDSMRTTDAVILPHGYFVDQPHIDLPLERWVCLVDAASGVSEHPTADELLTRPWVQNLAAREGMNPARRQLQFRGVEITVTAVTPHFFVIPSLVVGTDRIAAVPEGLAAMAVTMHPRLRVVAPPLDLEPVRDAFWWLADREHDAGHVWLQGLLRALAADII